MNGRWLRIVVACTVSCLSALPGCQSHSDNGERDGRDDHSAQARELAHDEATTVEVAMTDVPAAVRAIRTFERRCFILDVDRAVLARVRRPFPVEPIRTLDAVHLATAELLGEASPLVTIVTRDDRVRKNAEALGYTVE